MKLLKFKMKIKGTLSDLSHEWILLCLLLIHLLIQFDKQSSGIRAGKQPSAGFFVCLIWKSIWTMLKSRFIILHVCNGKIMLLSSFSTLPYTFCHGPIKSAFTVCFIILPIFFILRAIDPNLNSISNLQTSIQNLYWYN